MAMAFWPAWAAPMLNGAALLLALGFRRNRAVLVLAVLTLAALALADAGLSADGTRGADAARMFAPWLLLVAAALPERGFLARRNVVLLVALALSVWLTVAASDSLWPHLRAGLPFGLLPWNAGNVAAGLTFAAALACLLRWVLGGAPMEAGLGIVLGLAGFSMLPGVGSDGTSRTLALAGACALFAVLYASYRMAFVDALSGLPNRRALDETLARLTGDYALAMVDVDHFKQFNDTHGHDAGDRVLQAVAAELRRERRASSFRYGGEEFCLLFTGARSREAVRMCDQTRRNVEAMRVRIRSAPAKPRGGQAVKRREDIAVNVTVSIGVALRDAQMRMASDVLKAADQALYQAKSRGRNRVVAR
ncbi:MAG TPA: GGDEF domain-containing protein [Rudaea sp.]|jgi:diguanylate cyclase (GGDEF)-like protein|nr:GGDEF domain-containing protein [Rudaea sp.]